MRVGDRVGRRAFRATWVSGPLGAERRLANLISDRITPTLLPEGEALPWRDTTSSSCRCTPVPTRPRHLRRLGSEGLPESARSTAGGTLIEELRAVPRKETDDG